MKIKAPPPGSIIAGKYRVEGMLGVGGMGVVLSTRHVELDEPFAVKLLHAARSGDPAWHQPRKMSLSMRFRVSLSTKPRSDGGVSPRS